MTSWASTRDSGAVSFGHGYMGAPIILIMPITALDYCLKERSQIVCPSLIPFLWLKACSIIFLDGILLGHKDRAIRGWSAWRLSHTNDAMVAFAAIILLFIVPNGDDKTAVKPKNSRLSCAERSGSSYSIWVWNKYRFSYKLRIKR